MSLREGLIVDRYVVERSIGKGGTAEVWSVRHRTLGTRRALKVLFLERSDLHARLIEEGRAQARLSSDHIVPVLDVLDIDGAPALVMPLIEGPSLAQLLKVHRPSEVEVAAILRALLAGVESAHSAGLVHRDLKPSNVLLDLTSGGVQPRIADFGVARTATSDVTHTGVLLGTPVYAAPEQLRNAATADARADVWSLGVMLYELLTGTLPFRGNDVVALVRAMETETFPAPHDERWAELVRDLLRARPEARLCAFEEIRNRIDAISPPTDRSPLGAGTPLAAVAWRMRSPASVGTVTVPATGPPLGRGDNLPRERDAFVGRDAEAGALRGHLGGSPLVTVTGPGGVGKTRLVIHVARSLLGEFSGIAFCNLTEARSVDGILYAVARGLDVPMGADPIAQLGHAIAARGRCLIVMDNFEQVVDHAPATVGAWIDRAPDAIFLVTSREPLRLRGESIFPLDVLSLPLEDSPVTIDGSEAVSLFVIRAQQSDPNFVLAEDNAAAVARLVRQLDGLPLAIELAAARVRSSTPARLLERLSKRFDLLAIASRDVSDRQRSLRATLDWSWEQLTPTLQAALAQLSVFDGGWTLEAAEFVVRLDDGSSAVESALAELVDRSLVRMSVSAATGRPRFGMLVSVQEYASEKHRGLGAPDEADARHGAWFARSGTTEALDSLDVHGGVARGLALGRELDNLVAATRRAVARRDGDVAVATARAACTLLIARGPIGVAAELASAVAGLSNLPPQARAWATHLLGDALVALGRGNEAPAHFHVALEAALEAADPRTECVVLRSMGSLHIEQGRVDVGRTYLDAALAVARRLGNRLLEIEALRFAGIAQRDEGRLDDARAYYETALAIAREVGNRTLEGVLLGNLGLVHVDQGRLNEARMHYDAALVILRERGAGPAAAVVLGNLGNLHLAEVGRLNEARACYEMALAVHRELGSRRGEAIVLGTLGNLLRHVGDTTRARAYLTEALAVQREVGNRRGEGIALGNLGNLLRVVGDPEGARAHLSAALSLHRALRFTPGQPNWLHGLALLEADAGRLDEALHLAEEAAEVAAPFAQALPGALSALSRVHLARDEVHLARDTIARARAMNGSTFDALVAAVDALVAVAEGDRAAAEAALAEATADPVRCSPGTEVAQVVARARRGLESLAGARMDST